MNSWWKLIAVLAMFSGLGSANIDLPKQNRPPKNSTPTLRLDLSRNCENVRVLPYLRATW